MEGKGERVVTTDGKRYWSLALLFAAGVLNLFDRQIVNILGQDIKTELGLSDVQLGLLAGTAFGIFYGILGIPLGRLADRVDRVKLIAGVLVIWSGFTVLCGFAGSFLQLFVTRMGVGVGEAGSQPASTALIPDMFAAERRTSALALLLVSAPVGSFLGLLVGGFVGATWGWRTAFVMSGMPGFALAIVMVTTMRDPRAAVVRGMARPPNGNSVRWTEALRSLIRTPRFAPLALVMACATFLVYASGAWLPPFFIRVYGMSTAQIGWLAAIAVGVGGGAGALSGGILCDSLRSRVNHIEIKVLLCIFFASIPAILVTTLVDNRAAAIVSMFIFDICAYAWLGPTVTLIQNAVPSATRALSIAVCSTVASILSLSLGLPAVGALSDALRPHYGSGAIRYALPFCIVAVALGGILALYRTRYTEGMDADIQQIKSPN